MGAMGGEKAGSAVLSKRPQLNQEIYRGKGFNPADGGRG